MEIKSIPGILIAPATFEKMKGGFITELHQGAQKTTEDMNLCINSVSSLSNFVKQYFRAPARA